MRDVTSGCSLGVTHYQCICIGAREHKEVERVTSGLWVQFSHQFDTSQLVVWSVFLGTRLYFHQDHSQYVGTRLYMYFHCDHSQDVQLHSLPHALLIGVNGKFCDFVAANV